MADSKDRGPSFSTLNRLFGMLPSLKKGIQQKSTIGRGTPGSIRRPRKGCPICGTAYDWITTADDVVLEVKHCESCQGYLNKGHIAFVSDSRFAFVMPNDKLKDMAGGVVRLSSHVFDRLEDKFRIESQPREDGNSPPTPTAG